MNRFPALKTRFCLAALVGLAGTAGLSGCVETHARQLPDGLAGVDWLRPCRGLDGALCGSYDVWEDRDAAAGRRIALRVVVLPARGPDRYPDPVLYFAGGPGGAATAVARAARAEPWAGLNRTRDLVLIDRRGTGGSHRLDCDLYGDDLQRYVQEFLPAEAVRRCREHLEPRADLRLYTSPLAMDDIDEVRAALGYASVNLFGTSYGTREAMALMRQHPDTIRSSILLGVADPQLMMPAPYPRDTQIALESVLEACAADARCNGAFPDLRRELDRVSAGLDAAPATVSADGGNGAASISYGREVFGEMIRYLLYSTATANRLPLLVHQAAAGDFGPLVSWSAQRRRALAGADGLFLSVTCAQDVPYIDEAAAITNAAGTLLGLVRYEQQTRACELWPRGDLPPGFHEPLRSDVPVLLISGALDPVTPPYRATRVAAHLSDATHLVVPHAAHGWQGIEGTGCLFAAMRDFLDGGTAAVDRACVSSIRRRPFTLR